MRYLLRRRKRLCRGNGDAILLQRHGNAVGSSIRTRDVVSDPALMARLALDPSRQLVGARCAGTLILAKLGLLGSVPACTDLTTKPWVQETGVEVLTQPVYANGKVATAGGCFASPSLASWFI